MTVDMHCNSIEESVLLIHGGTGAGDGQDTPLVGVFARPACGERIQDTGVLIVVGGPQTRVGSHRQFVLLARALAAGGFPCLRFDLAGMGDSPGSKPDFERAAPDIRRACDALVAQVPGCERLALWGLCDGASAALLYAQEDHRIAAVIAANPWARSEKTRSAAIVSKHYGPRLRSADFWRRLFTGNIDVLRSAREVIGHMVTAVRKTDRGDDIDELPTRMAKSLLATTVPVRLQLSGRDLTASEFEIAMRASGTFDIERAQVARFADADHTFSDPSCWNDVVRDTHAFLAGAQSTRTHTDVEK